MTVLAATRYGTMECLPGDSVVSRSLALYGEWAQFELELLAGFIRAGMTVLDVGAFLGTHTLALAAMVGAQGAVHSFEPRADIRRVLHRNVERNALSQVTLHACALGSHATSLRIPAIDVGSESNFGGLALQGQEVAGDAPGESIRIERLDDLGLGHVDLIKIDAEGMEADVLIGAARTLKQSRPLVFAECNDLERGSKTLQECVAAGYAIFGTLAPAFNPSNLRACAENVFGEASEASLLAVPTEKVSALPQLGAREFAPIKSLDDLALLMVHKAQYANEVLAKGSAAAHLGLDFKSPLSRRQRESLDELQAAVRVAYARVDEAQQIAAAAQHSASGAQERATAAQQSAAAVQEFAERRVEEAMRRAELAARAAAAAQALADHFQRAEIDARRYQSSSLLLWVERLRRRLPGAKR